MKCGLLHQLLNNYHISLLKEVDKHCKIKNKKLRGRYVRNRLHDPQIN